MATVESLFARGWVRLHNAVHDALSRRFCYGLYDGERIEPFRRAEGTVPVLFAIPPMSDVNGPLPHPGVRILQTILRHQGVRCEVLNYNLPVNHPRDPFSHLIRAIRGLGVRILGVTTYSQAIRHTLEGLQRVRAACPDVVIVLGGPHPTESYLSLMGVSFVDYVCRGEAEESFPALVRELLAGRRPQGGAIPGVYSYNRHKARVEGRPAPFIDLEPFDRLGLLRYHYSADELKQYRLYRGCHGTAGAEYWPIALVRGCPYDCTFCAAYQMSGKKLRYRRVEYVVDDMEFYYRAYGRRNFSFIDDAFTENYEYVIALCREILNRGLRVYWTTDNGIRYETLGRGRRLEKYLAREGFRTVDDLLALMIRAGWRGTAVGIESGSARVRKELVRKGGTQLTNEEILANLSNLKRVARQERAYFYINGFLMAGFPRLYLPQGRSIPGESWEEMEQTWEFARELRDRGALDIMNLSIVIPLPGTDMWDALTIEQKMRVLTGCVPGDHPEAPALRGICERISRRYGGDPDSTRYNAEAEAEFWREVYRLSDEIQIRVMQSYDSFNADSAHQIVMDRVAPQRLWAYREDFVERFYSGFRMKAKMLYHVLQRSRSLHDVIAYLTLLARKYDPSQKTRSLPLEREAPRFQWASPAAPHAKA